MADSIQLVNVVNADNTLDLVKKNLLIRNAMEDILAYAQERAQQYAPYRTGNLKRAIQKDDPDRIGPFTMTGNISVGPAAPYGGYVHSGTGIYGPFATPIVSPSGNYLKWRDFQTGQTKFAKSVKGQRGTNFMGKAHHDTRILFIPVRLRALKVELAVAKKALP
jgi:hypothetical protein